MSGKKIYPFYLIIKPLAIDIFLIIQYDNKCFGGIAQLASASDWQSEGQGFKSPYLHHEKPLYRAVFLCFEFFWDTFGDTFGTFPEIWRKDEHGVMSYFSENCITVPELSLNIALTVLSIIYASC